MVPISAVLAALTSDETETLFLVIALGALAGAAYLAYLQRIAGAVMLVFVALVAAVLAT